MTTRLDPDDHLDGLLRDLDPAAQGLPALDHAAVIERATAPRQRHAGAADRRGSHAPGTRRLQPTRWAVPMAAAATVAVVAAGLAIIGVTQPPAVASDLVLAARQTQATPSGRVVGRVSVASIPDGTSVGGWRFSFDYRGGDFRARIDESGRTQRLVGVGERLYTTYAPSDGYQVQPRATAGEDLSIEQYLGVATAGRPVDGLVELLEQTRSITRTEGPGGTTRYAGSVPTAELRDLKDLLPGVSFLAAVSPQEGTGTLTVRASVAGQRLTGLVLRLVESSEQGRVDVTVRTRFLTGSDTGPITAPSRVQAPPTAQECRITASGDGSIEESAGCAPLQQTLDDFRAQHPDDPCLRPDGTAVRPGQEFVRCLERGGHDEAAKAYREYFDAFPPSMR